MTEVERNINILLELAEFLCELDRSDLDMRLIIRWKNHIRWRLPPKKAVHCKTVCCVAGWATRFHPRLSLSLSGSLRLDDKAANFYDAFASAFGIPFQTAFNLCCSCARHKKPKAAARAVEKVAAELAEQHGYEIVEV